MVRAGIRGSQSTSVTVHGAPTIAVTNIRFVWGANDVTLAAGGTLSPNPRVGELIELRVGLTAGNGRGGSGHGMQNAAYDLIHPEFGSIGGGMMGSFDGAGETEVDAAMCASGAVAGTPLGDTLQTAFADTGTLRVTANEITITDPNTGWYSTGPSSNTNFTVTVVAG